MSDFQKYKRTKQNQKKMPPSVYHEAEDSSDWLPLSFHLMKSGVREVQGGDV